MKLSLETVRTLAVVQQGLHRHPRIPDKHALLGTIRRIGLLQLDSVNVVARSHNLVMLSRVGPFDPANLDALLYPDRALFEHWAHAACLIPVEQYAFFAPAIRSRRQDPLHSWVQRRLGDEPQGVLDNVLAEVRERGPLASKDFEDPGRNRGTWWDWKPAKTALEVLFARGDLLVERRVNFQRYYDLGRRVLPASAEPPARTLADWQRWATLRSVSHLGVATASQASDYYRQKKPIVRSTINELCAEGTLVSVDVEGWNHPAYLNPADLRLVREIETGAHQPGLTAFLSPFDNLIWDRERVRDLFGFDYRTEMYVPAVQRRYGYYVMPILHGNQLVGRLDPKMDRRTGTLFIRAIYLEPDQPLSDHVIAGISDALVEFMAFHEADSLVIERSEPEGLRPALLEHTSQAKQKTSRETGRRGTAGEYHREE